MIEGDQVIRGRYVPPEQKAEMDSLRAVFDTKSAMDRLDAYGKWLFGSATIVGSLGAGLSSSLTPKLRGVGTWSFGLAVLAFGVCLVTASLSIAPKWVTVRLQDLASLHQAVNTQFRARQVWLTLAAIFFAFALALSSVSPLLSLANQKKIPVVHYSKDVKGALDVGVEGENMEPGAIVGVRLEVAGISKASAASTVDSDGRAKLTLRTTEVDSSAGNADVVLCIKKPEEKQCVDSSRLSIPR